MTRQITCEEASRYVYRYLDGELEPSTATELESHLEVCRLCMGVIAFERRMIEFVQDSSTAEIAPPGLRDRIQRVLEQPSG